MKQPIQPLRYAGSRESMWGGGPRPRVTPWSRLLTARNTRISESGRRHRGTGFSLCRLLICVLLAGNLSAQLPRRFYAWWSSPVVQDLNLSPEQQRRVRQTLREYRPHLQDIRTAVDGAEQDVEEQFNADPIDPQRVDKAIERLIAARAELTRTLTQMSLKLRTVLTQQQWQELQRRRPTSEKEKEKEAEKEKAK